MATDTPMQPRQQVRPELISVVIPMLDSADTLAAQLEALACQTYRGAWEVVIADNGSTDGSIELVRSWTDKLPALQVVDASARKGANYARNVGAAAARGEFLVYCDADDVATPGWLDAMAAALRNCDLVGGGIDEVPLNDPLARSWHPRYRADPGLPRWLDYKPFALSANLGVRRAAFHDLGGWSDDYVRGETRLNSAGVPSSNPIAFASPRKR